MRVTQLSSQSFIFPSPELALREPNGLLALGGDLTAPRLLAAYQRGIFPWFNPGEMILWWSPDPRAVLFPEDLHISRSMRRFIRHCPYRFTLNHAFADVISACATERDEGTWIGRDVQQAYCQLHALGHAHSLEVWLENELVGGLYGVAVGAVFCGESMFSRADNASKSALMVFCHHFTQHGGELIDCQVLNAHTASLGAVEIPRNFFLQQLSQLQFSPLPAECWLPQSLNFSSAMQ
ncbi:leucyl/phenylalanyl-tRNA--protein transferase [Yersinia pestis]|uniref:Leucyl/phenylalanyl-tRNA--protein transferase n=15 Tax=Yersinia pseudotuberculosis complex TaxID=1649845 RepID=LFTR_YERPE|nr:MULTISPECIES: leucyl/phenylalanyl-tRNA--protein transferase [Yersinia pseudotuberculosis complex]A4TN37.1 RecName: Full=Leucyl/phenylalanyl-tRNA--protein transferase; AltName: Full=L/F-transferase; AltName: Full=Leucyltransferase; AltName: Full=Phenyalanyltransferase [Yersinia pestis Pestoides F]A7FJZ0.1 RecName: Full=Leucyl/phenylalanyl-tRNA--protein transferase; AltName: Full=L/F-transferase; AltName: Full=Leucyltransferase; AltName: Full=Phenyalanyltransferase [Yersinia pseudotuberculosis I